MGWSDIQNRQSTDSDHVNDSVGQKIYIVLTDRTVLFGDYGNGFDPKENSMVAVDI
jgi:hypothetical protein